jgi:predicted nucleic acid-binding protein
MTILLDTSVLVAYFNRRDQYHAAAARLVPELLDEHVILIEPVLHELFYVLSSRAGYSLALSGRLSAPRIATFDRRDFQIFRNTSGFPLPLLPQF